MWGWWEQFWGKGTGMTPAEMEFERDGVTRRDFLRAGSLSVVGLSLAEQAAFAASAVDRRRAVIVLMNGGPSQLDTFDPKPHAPNSVRGPLRAISTSVPGVAFSETLPMLAQRLDRCGVIRTLHHDAAAIHETGCQLLLTGRLQANGLRFPHVAALAAEAGGWSAEDNVIVPQLLQHAGVHPECGQSGGYLGPARAPVAVSSSLAQEPDAVVRAYGETAFGRRLLQARQQLDRGVRCVTVNLCDTLHKELTWDAHGDWPCGPATVCDYRDHLCPQFDQALAAFLDELANRGLWDDTLVIATGEFGRTPLINDRGGRDHWTSCWSALVAGAGISGGTVLGASDGTAAEPLDQPIHLDRLAATVLAWFGLDGRKIPIPGAKGDIALTAAPLTELWGLGAAG